MPSEEPQHNRAVHRFVPYPPVSLILCISLSSRRVLNMNLEKNPLKHLSSVVCSTPLLYRLATCLRRSVALITLVLVWLVCHVAAAKAKRAAKAPTRKRKGS